MRRWGFFTGRLPQRIATVGMALFALSTFLALLSSHNAPLPPQALLLPFAGISIAIVGFAALEIGGNPEPTIGGR